MSHGTIEIPHVAPPSPAKRDHTGDALRAALASAIRLARIARENVKDAEQGLALARLADERARENEQRARAALVAHQNRKEARA